MSPEVLRRKLDHLSAYLNDLRDFKGCSFETYQANHYKVDRLLELIITTATDVMFHLLSKKDEPTPSAYSQAFLRAGELKMIPMDLAARLAQAAGLRNVLAHGYEDVDPSIVFKSIDAALRDFPELMRALESA